MNLRIPNPRGRCPTCRREVAVNDQGRVARDHHCVCGGWCPGFGKPALPPQPEETK
jgi:hypothetical protein